MKGVAHHEGSIRAFYPAAPGSILDIPKIFILDVAENYLRHWSEERGPRLDNVDRTRLEVVMKASTNYYFFNKIYITIFRQVVAKRNARERRRVHAVNMAFVRLRKAVPLDNKVPND